MRREDLLFSLSVAWFHLLAHRVAVIQSSLPANRSCLSDHCRHRQRLYREKISFHVSFRTGARWPRSMSIMQRRRAPVPLSHGFLAALCPKPPASGIEGDLKPRGLASNTVSAVPYSAPRTSACHTCDAGRSPRTPDPSFRRVQHHRNDCLLRHMQRERDRAKHGAADKRCPDDSQLFHEIFPSLFY